MAIVKEAEFSETIEPTDTDQQLQIPTELPVLPLRDIVIYPFMIVPLFVSREKSIRAVDEALAENRMILLASQKDLDKEEPTAEDLYSVGTAAVIMRMLKLPDGRIRILVQGLARAHVGVEVEELAELDDGGEVDEVLALELGRELLLRVVLRLARDRAEERARGALEDVDGAVGQRVALLAPELPPDVGRHVLGVEPESVEHQPRRFHHIHADPVTGHPGDFVLGHDLSPVAMTRT